MATKSKNVIVLGAGVIGLTTAVAIQERGGYNVTIISEILPGDTKSIRYTSHWAGAHHIGGGAERKEMDRRTFDIMWKLSEPSNPAERCFLRLYQEEFYCEVRAQPDPLDHMPEFRVLPKDSLGPKNAVHGISFNTVTADVPVYLEYLSSRLLAAGASIVRGAVQHIDQVVEGGAEPFTRTGRAPEPPDAVVVCVGLGARTLGGVEDKNVFPIRGQTVLLRAPWVRSGRTLNSDTGLYTYVIPRRSGDVIIGGTIGVDDWYPFPRPEITRDILARVVALYPEIAPPEIRAVREPVVEDLLPIIIEEGCGLRPGRKGGIRLEAEWAELRGGNRKVPIVHNYGHGGHGYISSWGSAEMALDLLEDALK